MAAIPPLPAQGSTGWYAWAQGIDGGARIAARSSSVVTLGDSITAADGVGTLDGTWGTDATLYQGPFGYIVWAQNALQWRFTLLRNIGVAGYTTANLLGRLPDVLAANPSICIVMGGRNDIDGASISAPSTIANLASICDQILAAGIVPVLATVLPASSETTAQIQQRENINTGIINYARTTEGVILCDWASVWSDPATGLPAAGMTTDGIHPSRDGATRMGNLLASVLGPIFPGSKDLVNWNGDSRSLGVNPCMTGTGGGKGTGVTGTVADNWTVSASTGTATPTCSVIARTDGPPGQWQQIKNPGGAVQLYYTGYAGSMNTLWTPGATKYYVECEFERDNDWSGITLFGMQSFMANQSNNVYASMSFAGGTHGANSIWPMSGVLRSPAALITSACTGIGVGVKFEGATGTLRVGRVAVRAAP